MIASLSKPPDEEANDASLVNILRAWSQSRRAEFPPIPLHDVLVETVQVWKLEKHLPVRKHRVHRIAYSMLSTVFSVISQSGCTHQLSKLLDGHVRAPFLI